MGSAKRKNTSQLKTTAPNNEWFKNVVKSVGYATSDIVKETIPSAFEFTDSNTKDAIELYNELRQEGPKSVTKMLAQSLEKNAYLKMANDALNNTREDIRTGKFYNREREERAVIGDEDFTFGDGDFDFDFDDNDFGDSGDSELSDPANKVTTVKKVTVNNINANITKNNPMVQSINRQSEVILASADATNKVNTALATTSYTLTSKVASDMMTGMSTINDNLSALVNFNNDSMSKYVAASLQYYSDSLSVLNSTLEHFKSSNNPEVKEEKEQINPFLSNGGLNIKSYGQLLKKNMSNVIQDDLILNSLYSFASDKDTIGMLAASPLKLIPKMISKVIVPTIVRESAAEFDKSFSNFFPALLNKFNKMADGDNWFLKKVGQLFGFKPKNKTSVDISEYNKGDMNFNGITQKAITEVIPTYLRKILSAISGKNEMIFDYQTGKYTDYMEAVKEREKLVRDKSLGSMEVYGDLKSRLDAIRFTDENDKKEMFKDFDDFMYKLSKSNGINPHVRTVKGEKVDDLKDIYSGQFSEIFRSALLSLNKSDVIKLMGTDIFSAKESVNKFYEDAQANIGSSIIPVLEAWKSEDEYEEAKDGKFKRKNPFTDMNIDKFGKSNLDYLREMRNLLVEGIVVYGGAGTKSRRIGNSDSESAILRSRRNRLDEIDKKTKKVTNDDQQSKFHNVKPYSESERARLKAKGIMVADSVSEITADATSTQLADMFKTYDQLKNSDGKASNQLNSAGGWVKKMFSKGSKKAQGVGDVFNNLLSMPGRVVSNVLDELDSGLYKLIFGVNQDGSDQSFLSKVVTSIKTSFTGFFDWTKEKFFDPLHDALLGEQGLLTKIKNSQAMESMKKFGRKMGDWAFGNIDETGHRRDGAMSAIYNDLKDVKNSVQRIFTGKGYTDRNGQVIGRDENSVFGNVNGVMKSLYDNGKLYMFGNKKDQYVERQMLMPTAFGNSASIGQVDSANPYQSLYSPEAAAERAKQPVVRLNGNVGNGGSNMFTWLKDNLKMQYSVDVNGKQSDSKVVNFGESINTEVGSGGVAPTMVNGFPYFSQRDPRYANTPYNLSTGKGGGSGIAFGDRGCGPAAMSMVANGLGQDVDPLSMAEVATEGGYSVDGGTKGSFFKSIGEKLGFNAKEKQTSSSQVESALMQGKPMIFRGRKTTDRPTPFTTDGHFVVGVGGKNGKVKINDPNGLETSGEYNIDDIVSESNKMWTFDDTGKGSSFNPEGPKYDVVTQKVKKEKYVTDWSRKISGDGSGHINGVFSELADGFREASADMVSLIFGEAAGEEDKESRVKEFGMTFRDHLPKAISGGILGGSLGAVVGATGGMGLIGSFFLPGGPIGAAMLGTALGFATQSTKVQNWLFGTEDPEDSSKRVGGFISQKTQEFFKKNKTTIIGGAALGGLKGLIGGTGVVGSMLFGGPITGALMGAGIGLAVRSEKFQDMVFGKSDEETGKKIGGLLSSSYNSVVDNKKLIAGGGIGVLGGMGVGALMSSMGILGGTMFLGPVGGAIAGAGLGIAAASEKWRDSVFGTLNEDTKKREGGLMGEVKASLIHDVLTPLKDKANETAIDMKYWFQESMMLPIAGFFDPFKKFTSMISEEIIWKFQDITTGIKGTFEKYIGEPMQTFMRDAIFNPIRGFLDKTFNLTMKATRAILGSPFKLLDMASYGMAGMVQRKAEKRQKKHTQATQGLYELEQLQAQNGSLTPAQQRRYDKLRKQEDRNYISADDERLTYKTDWKQRREAQKAEVRTERDAKKAEFAQVRETHKRQRKFNSIFGPTVEYDDELLTQYEQMFARDNGKQIKGKKNKKLIRQQAAEFVSKAKEGKAASVDVKAIRTDIHNNLTPMTKLLYSIEKIARGIGEKVGAKLPKAINIKGKGKAQVVDKPQKPDSGKGGSRDAAWLMTGKGPEKEDKKKGGFLSSIGSTMVSALKKFDKHNDAEEDKKYQEKQQKAQLAEERKSVTGKNYKALSAELANRAKEEKEQTFRDRLLGAVENIKTTTGEHKIGWDSIFSKKGLITGALMIALPALAKFFMDPAKVLGDIMNGIKISIGWLFGNNNGSRTDSTGKQVLNSGLTDASGRLIRNSAKGIANSSIVQKTGRVLSKTARGGAALVTDIKNGLTLSENAQILLREGVQGADQLAEFGVRNVDDLVELGIRSVDDLAALGVKSSGDLAKLGIKTSDDLAKLGVDLSSRKGGSQLSKLGMKSTHEFAEDGLLSSTAAKKSFTSTVKDSTVGAGKAVVSAAEKPVSAVVETATKATNSKFVKSIMDWLTAAFTNNKVVKEMGSEAAQKTLKELTTKVSKFLTEGVLKKFAKPISIATAEVAGRVAAGATTAGLVTVAFGVVDFVSGAVNAERLFEVPPGTATFGMRTMSAVLQTILGIGMIGPIIDVANEIIAEVTGVSFLSIIASVGYSYMSKDGAIELKNLQAEFNEDYLAYKEANGLENFSKRAYQDTVNPSFGTKVWNGTKKAGNWLTAGVFDTNDIRGTLGKGEDQKVTISDRFSAGIGNITQGLTFGRANGGDITRSVAGGLNSAKDWMSGAWDSTKTAAKGAGHALTGNLFNDDRIRKELGLGEDVKLGLKDRVSMGAASMIERFSFGNIKTDETIKTIYGIQTQIGDNAKKMWETTKTEASKAWEGTKTFVTDALDAGGKLITGQIGLFDENGDPLPLGEGISVVKDKAVSTVKGFVTDVKTEASAQWNELKTGFSNHWNSIKQNTSEALNIANKHLGGLLGFQDENGEVISLTDGVSRGVDSFTKSIGSVLTGVKDTASKVWETVSTKFTEFFKGIPDMIDKGIEEVNKFLGKVLGFEDESGNPVTLTSAVKTGWSNTVDTASNIWNSVTGWMGNNKYKKTAEADIAKRNASANGGYGGFGGEGIPMNIGGRGCGPTAMAMVTSKLTGQQVDPVSMSNLATQGGFAGQYGTNGQYFKYAADKFGINAQEGRTTQENLTRALSAGQPVILRGQSDGAPGSAFTRSGHYVVAVGQQDGKVLINDPRGANYSGAYNMEDVVGQSNVMWSFGSKQGPYGTTVPGLVLGGASSDAIPGELIYKYAAVHVGKPYVWGANGPNSFDCSGLVNYAAKQAGVRLPSSRPTAATWSNYCKKINRTDLKVGDLGFFRENGTVTHLGIYAGDGQWCHAEGGSGPKGAGGKVKVNGATYFNEFGRIPGVSATSTQYIGNSVMTEGTTGKNRSGGVLSNIAGFIGSLGTEAINSAITGQAPQFMSFSEYMANSNGSSSSSVGYLNTPYNGETVSLGSRKTDANTLNKYLGGKLSNKGDSIIRISQEHGVDPAFVASILHHESANGTSNAIVNKNNPGGIMDPKTNWSKLKVFPSLESGIDYTVSNLKRNYLSKGLDTIPEIGSKYAPIGAANDPNNQNVHWVPNVTKLYNQYSYSPALASANQNFEPTRFDAAYGGFGGDDTSGTMVNTDTIGNYSLLPNDSDTPRISKSYTFNDRMSKVGMGENYIKSMVQTQVNESSSSDKNISDIMDKVLKVLSTIADNTGITSKNIKDAVTSVMTSNTSVTSVNNISAGGTTKKTVNTNAQYSQAELRDRDIAQQIAAGRFA